MTDDSIPKVLFLCVHNAGRSQMALGWFTHLAGDRATASSGGSEPANEVNPSAVAVMAEVGIDISGEHPKRWTDEIVGAADVVVTMGCGDTCPFVAGTRYEDWELADSAGLDVAAVRPVRDEIERRVRHLLESLGVSVRKTIPIYDATEPITCTASGDEVAERIEAIERLRVHLTGLHRTEHGLVLHFPRRDDIEADVRAFAAEEKACCRFWGFDVAVTADEVQLRWDGPPSAAELIDRLRSYFEGDEPITAIEGLL